MKEIKAILFDLDDTLLVEKNSAKESFIETICSIDFKADKEEFVGVIKEEARKLWYEMPVNDYCLKIGISSWEGLWADFDGDNDNLRYLKAHALEYRRNTWINALSRYGIASSLLAEELGEKFKAIRNTKHNVSPDALSCLEQLKPYAALGLITNGAPDIQQKKIKGSGLSHFFKSIVISGEYGVAKPDASIFNEVLRQLRYPAAHALMVGDTLKTDIQGAVNAGIRSVWVNRNNKETDTGKLKPDYEINDLSMLCKWFFPSNSGTVRY